MSDIEYLDTLAEISNSIDVVAAQLKETNRLLDALCSIAEGIMKRMS